MKLFDEKMLAEFDKLKKRITGSATIAPRYVFKKYLSFKKICWLSVGLCSCYHFVNFIKLKQTQSREVNFIRIGYEAARKVLWKDLLHKLGNYVTMNSDSMRRFANYQYQKELQARISEVYTKLANKSVVLSETSKCKFNLGLVKLHCHYMQYVLTAKGQITTRAHRCKLRVNGVSYFSNKVEYVKKGSKNNKKSISVVSKKSLNAKLNLKLSKQCLYVNKYNLYFDKENKKYVSECRSNSKKLEEHVASLIYSSHPHKNLSTNTRHKSL